jgi:SAM-dependent methyltransferase
MTEGSQAEIDRRNAEFWNELCGTQLAQSLGVVDFSADSLAKFDRYYLQIYPYLHNYLALDTLAGKDVLEIGLGYGTVAQLLAGRARHYTGLDIAGGPVAVVNQRLSLFGLPGSAKQGNILEAPFASNSFDAVVTIGCLHHTGNLPRALEEVHRVLRPGGRALVMVYNAFSYRRWWTAPSATWHTFAQDYFGSSGDVATSATERGAYDRDRSGAAAPATVFTSSRRLRALCSRFSSIEIHKENAEQEPPFSKLPRMRLLPIIGPVLGLDLYATLRK